MKTLFIETGIEEEADQLKFLRKAHKELFEMQEKEKNG